jgi:hypothetical protein
VGGIVVGGIVVVGGTVVGGVKLFKVVFSFFLKGSVSKISAEFPFDSATPLPCIGDIGSGVSSTIFFLSLRLPSAPPSCAVISSSLFAEVVLALLGRVLVVVNKSAMAESRMAAASCLACLLIVAISSSVCLWIAAASSCAWRRAAVASASALALAGDGGGSCVITALTTAFESSSASEAALARFCKSTLVCFGSTPAMTCSEDTTNSSFTQYSTKAIILRIHANRASLLLFFAKSEESSSSVQSPSLSPVFTLMLLKRSYINRNGGRFNSFRVTLGLVIPRGSQADSVVSMICPSSSVNEDVVCIDYR